jgi:hypothetical protein
VHSPARFAADKYLPALLCAYYGHARKTIQRKAANLQHGDVNSEEALWQKLAEVFFTCSLEQYLVTTIQENANANVYRHSLR